MPPPGRLFRTKRSQYTYEELPDYTISGQGRDGYTATRLILADWNDAVSVMKDLAAVARVVPDGGYLVGYNSLGAGTAVGAGNFTRASAYRLSRLPPEQHPVLPELTVSGVDLVEGVGYPDATPDVDVVRFRQTNPTVTPVNQGINAATGAINWGGTILPDPQGKARLRVSYRRQPYVTQVLDRRLSDLTGGNYDLQVEMLRFCTRQWKPNVQATQVGGSIFHFVRLAGDPGPAGGAPVPLGTEPPAKMLPFGEVRYTFYQWPALNVPRAAALVTTTLTAPGLPAAVTVPALLGRVNDAPFDWQGLSPIYDPFPVGTLLFLGAESTEPYWHLGAEQPYIDLTLVFGFQPSGWNAVYRRGVGFRRVTVSGDPLGLGAVWPVATDDAIPYNFGPFPKLLAPELSIVGPANTYH